MKRKTGNRDGWTRINKQNYVQMYINNQHFKGYVTLIHFIDVIHPLKAKIAKQPLTLIQNGTYLMQHIPDNEAFALTTYLHKDGTILQWYIDIIDSSGIENEIPYFDDLYLDLIVTFDGAIIEKDIDELEEALQRQDITRAQYDKAWQAFEYYKERIKKREFYCINEGYEHFKQLQQHMI